MEKYKKLRGELNHGDIALFRGKGFLAKSIQYFDKAYYNHIGVILKYNNRLWIIDSVAKGVHPEFLSERMSEYVDFCIVRPNKNIQEIESALNVILDKAEGGIKYDFLLLPRIAISRKLNIDLKKLGSSKKDVCSEFARRDTDALGLECYKKNTQLWTTPQDFVRFAEPKDATVLFDESSK